MVPDTLLRKLVRRVRQQKDQGEAHLKRDQLTWTVIPVLIVLVLGMATARTAVEVQGKRMPADALKVTVIGHQWWWEFRYPDLGIVTANELHVPLSTAAKPAVAAPQT